MGSVRSSYSFSDSRLYTERYFSVLKGNPIMYFYTILSRADLVYIHVLEVCGYSICSTRPVPVLHNVTHTRTRPVLKISTRPYPYPRVYPYPLSHQRNFLEPSLHSVNCQV